MNGRGRPLPLSIRRPASQLPRSAYKMFCGIVGSTGLVRLCSLPYWSTIHHMYDVFARDLLPVNTQHLHTRRRSFRFCQNPAKIDANSTRTGCLSCTPGVFAAMTHKTVLHLYLSLPRSLIIPPYRYHQRYSSSMVGSRVGGRGSGRRLVMPPGAPIGPMGSSARHGARTSILDLDYSAKVSIYLPVLGAWCLVRTRYFGVFVQVHY